MSGSDVFKIDHGREVDHRLMLGEEAGSFLNNPFPIRLGQSNSFKKIGIGSKKGLYRLPLCLRLHGVLVFIHQLNLEFVVHECRVGPDGQFEETF